MIKPNYSSGQIKVCMAKGFQTNFPKKHLFIKWALVTESNTPTIDEAPKAGYYVNSKTQT